MVFKIPSKPGWCEAIGTGTMPVMTQQDLGLNLSTQRTGKAVFLDEINLVVPWWTELVALIAPHAPKPRTGRPPFALQTMLRIHFLQQWFGLSDLAMEEALFEVALYSSFVGLSNVEHIPDRVSILRFRHLLDEHQIAAQILAPAKIGAYLAWYNKERAHSSISDQAPDEGYWALQPELKKAA